MCQPVSLLLTSVAVGHGGEACEEGTIVEAFEDSELRYNLYSLTNSFVFARIFNLIMAWALGVARWRVLCW